MGLYRARDLLLAPSLCSLMRLPLACLFVLLVDEPVAAFAVLALAAFTDVVDGYIARRFQLVTPTGAAIDPITDKIFVLTVLATLVGYQRLQLAHLVLLSMREFGELPLVVWFAVSRRARKARAEYPSANLVGKAATVLQFGTVTAALFQIDHLEWWLWASAIGGTLAAISYWARALDAARR